MKLLVLGANGQVGFELLRSLAPLGEVIAATRDGQLIGSTACELVDLTDDASITRLIDHTTPQWIINAAAYTAVDRAETQIAEANVINAKALGVIGARAKSCGARVIHYSTDYVFDGKACAAQRETDTPNPQNVYGQSKLLGEQLLADSGAGYWIFRVAWMYATRGHNFAKTMLRLANERDQLRVVADQIGAPTPARWIAQATALAISRPHHDSGIWHLAPSGQTSWHGFADYLLERAHQVGLIARKPQIEPISSAEYPTPAARPGFSVLDSQKFLNDFSLLLPPWQRGVEQIIAELAAK